MTNVLVVDSSLNGEAGNSARLTRYFAETLARTGDVDTVFRDTTQALDHLSAQEMQAWMAEAPSRSPEQRALASLSETIVDEVQRADIIVIGMPLYNFGVPSSFKAWIDRLARGGITFRYTENGPEGLLSGKKVYVLAARGGRYAGTPMDSQTPYLRDVLGFIGLTDVAFVFAEGLAMGDEQYEASMAAARAAIDGHVAALADMTLASVA